MFFGGIIAVLLGALILAIMLLGRFSLEMTYSLARIRIPSWTLYERIVIFFSYALIAFGGVSTTIATVEYVIKWLK